MADTTSSWLADENVAVNYYGLQQQVRANLINVSPDGRVFVVMVMWGKSSSMVSASTERQLLLLVEAYTLSYYSETAWSSTAIE